MGRRSVHVVNTREAAAGVSREAAGRGFAPCRANAAVSTAIVGATAPVACDCAWTHFERGGEGKEKKARVCVVPKQVLKGVHQPTLLGLSTVLQAERPPGSS